MTLEECAVGRTFPEAPYPHQTSAGQQRRPTEIDLRGSAAVVVISRLGGPGDHCDAINGGRAPGPCWPHSRLIAASGLELAAAGPLQVRIPSKTR